MKRGSAAYVARLGVLTAVALALGWIDRMLPVSAVPGVKLGLANLVLLYALYLMDNKTTVLLMLLKVFLTGLLFGASAWTFFVSLGGGVLSVCAMMLARCVPRIGIVPVSMAGAVFHIVGQLAVILLLQMAPWQFVLVYLPVLGVAAVCTGLLTGVVAKYSLRAFAHAEKKG